MLNKRKLSVQFCAWILGVREFATLKAGFEYCRCKNMVFVERFQTRRKVGGYCRQYYIEEMPISLTACPETLGTHGVIGKLLI